MNNGINLTISNRLRKVLDFKGETEYVTGKTTIESESSRDGDSVHLYIQNKGFGSSSSKSVRTTLDNETCAELVVFLQRHLELSAKVAAMRNCADHEGE